MGADRPGAYSNPDAPPGPPRIIDNNPNDNDVVDQIIVPGPIVGAPIVGDIDDDDDKEVRIFVSWLPCGDEQRYDADGDGDADIILIGSC